MKKATITASLGRAIARFTTEPFNFPVLTIVFPAAETDFGLIPAQSVELQGGEIKALVQLLIDAGCCAPVPPLLLCPPPADETAQPDPNDSKERWWRSDKQADAVLSTKPADRVPNRHEQENLEYYGGHLIAESVTPKNMPLICAAPDLLDACEEAIAWFEDRMPGIAVDAKDSLRMAIAKAKSQPKNPA